MIEKGSEDAYYVFDEMSVRTFYYNLLFCSIYEVGFSETVLVIKFGMLNVFSNLWGAKCMWL